MGPTVLLLPCKECLVPRMVPGAYGVGQYLLQDIADATVDAKTALDETPEAMIVIASLPTSIRWENASKYYNAGY